MNELTAGTPATVKGRRYYLVSTLGATEMLKSRTTVQPINGG